MLARVIPLVLGLAVLVLPRVVRAQCVPLDTSTFAGLKAGGCLTGGIATDAAGVSTPRIAGGDAPAEPMGFTASTKGLTVQIPATATIRKAYLAIYAKRSGGFNGNPEVQVKLNGILLDTAPEVDRNNAAGDGYRVYDVTTGFGITGSGVYSVEERGDADLNFQTEGAGLGGEQIVIVFDDPQHTQARHVTFQPTFLSPANGVAVPFDVTGLPTCGGAPTNAVISFSEMFECSDEQNGLLQFRPGAAPTFATLTTRLGGRDDGAPGLSASCGAQDWNSLITAGSFGYDDNGSLVGVAGDSPTAEPAGATGSNSRVSDELFSTGALDLSGILNVRYTGDGNEVLTSTTVAIDLFDADCDTLADTVDNCPVTPNPGQADLDGDGIGDACDPTTCGNGTLEVGEGCDDGDTAAGDGCNAACLVENGLACNANPTGVTGSASCASGLCDATGGAPGTCEPVNSCGNGVLEAAEGCDDGANVAADGCSAACLVENGLACNANPTGVTGNASCASGLCDATGGAPGICEPVNSCGNGVLEAGEGCDDGATAADDGCNAACLVETSMPCNANPTGATGSASCASGVCDATGGEPGICEVANTCGNGVIEPGEGCDDGAAAPGNGCNASCLVETGLPCNANPTGATGDASCASGICDATGGAPGICEPSLTCGNGVIEAGEGCDDGAGATGDGCNADCLVETSSVCNTDPDGNTGASSCASGFCDPDGMCSLGVRIAGGGCSAGSGGAGGSAALMLLLVLWVISALQRRRSARAATPWMRRRLQPIALGGLCALGAMAGASREASAQISTRYSAERFELTGHRDGILGVEWGDVRGHLVLDAGMWVGYANDPVNVYAMSTGDRLGSLVHDRVGGDLVVALRLMDRLELGVGASLIFAQSENLGAAMIGGDIAGTGLGNVRITSKVAVARRGRTALAVMLGLGLPTSTVDDYGGDRSVTFSPALALSHQRGGVRLAANLGYRARSSTQALDLMVDDEVYARVGLGYRFASSLELDASFDVATGADDVFGAVNRNHAELRGGVAYDVTPSVRLFGATGVGVAEGFGTPDWRALMGIRLGSRPRTTRTPEPRVVPEPPRDRDGDGILDVADRCPNEPENRNSFEDDDGCPDDPDPDHDTVIGAADQCPDQAEDLDGFEDGNGCPDPDNDGDTVLDADDQCRDVPGVPAMKGCPDPDRDGDTVVDRLDNCPDEPGLVENQGCKKKELVKIVDGKLEILEVVYFGLDAAVIEQRSYPLLDNVARVLSAQPRITKIRVEGYTDDQGDDDYNKKLSQRRADAVLAYLINKGIDAGRLEAVGFGEEQPKTTNSTAEGRATNRRVEFVTVDVTR